MEEASAIGTLIFSVCCLWSLAGLITPKALFFAIPSKKKRIHAVFFPLLCMFTAAALETSATTEGDKTVGWVMAVLFCALTIFYGIRLRREKTTSQTTAQPNASGFNAAGNGVPLADSNLPRASQSRSQGGRAKWYGPSESVKIQGLTIPGMVYVGEKLPDAAGYSNDPSLINPKLKALAAEPWQSDSGMNYWPSYERISPTCRGAYLKWLATGRSEPEADIGYVFLFFYGLERRLFFDGVKQGLSDTERQAITSEVHRLLGIYGGNRSFQGYANNLLAMDWVLFQSHEEFPENINLAACYSSDPFQVQLARHVAAGAPLSSDMALQWLALHPEFGLRTPARRCAKEFRELFAHRYTEQYGEGIIVPPNKKRLSVSYHAASSSLRGLRFDFPDLPDPFMLAGTVKKLFAIADACTDELDAYSRHLGRKENTPTPLAALALLPKELVFGSPAAQATLNALHAAAGSGPGLMKTKALYEALGESAPAQLGKKEAENLAVLIEKLGFGIIPDVRYYGIKPDTHSEIVIFLRGHGLDFRPSGEFRLVASMIRLGAMVSQCDGNVSPHEEAVLKNLVQDNRNLTGIEKDSLLAYLHWSLHTPQGTSGLKQKLAELGESEKGLVSRILVTVAHADGYLDPKEIKQLEKLYTALGLDKALVTGDLHTANTDAPVTVAQWEHAPSHSIPAQSVPSPGFTLNKELIRIREQETQQVRSVLENIFTEEEHETASATIGQQDGVKASGSPFENLDTAHQKLLLRLKEQTHWEREAVYEVCKDLGLMPDGALEVLNEWAFENANAPLIDDGEPIYFDIELAKEILNEH